MAEKTDQKTVRQPAQDPAKGKLGFKLLPAGIALALALLIAFAIPVPQGVTPRAWHLLAMFVGVIAAIIGKAMPIGALSMVAITLVAVTGVTADAPENAIKDALSSFANPLIWLIGASIMISRGLLKTGLGARIGYFSSHCLAARRWALATAWLCRSCCWRR